jgi:anti-sigma factor RsiW
MGRLAAGRLPTVPSENAELVALIDNELDQDATARLLVRLTEDEALRKRYESCKRLFNRSRGGRLFFAHAS